MTQKKPDFDHHRIDHDKPIRITLKNAEIDGKEAEVMLNKAFEIIFGEVYRNRFRKNREG